MTEKTKKKEKKRKKVWRTQKGSCAQKPHRTLLKVLFSYSDFGKVISNHFILVKGFQNLYVYAKIACTFSKKETLPQVKGSSKE